MMIVRTQLLQTSGIFIIALAFVGMLMFSGCDGDETTGPPSHQVVEIAISPDTAAFDEGDQVEFSVLALTATGDTVDTEELDIEWEWWSSEPEVFTVAEGGVATGQNTGEAYCIVEAVIEDGSNATTLSDESIDVAGFVPDGQGLISTGNEEITSFNNIAFKKRMRFVGRDSAFVMVF